LKLVVDASVAMAAATTPVGFARLRRAELPAPPLMWIETTSALHAAMWRGALGCKQAELMRGRIAAAPIAVSDRPELSEQAWAVADELGWAKTYDANYIALARLLDARVVTLDARLRRGAGRTGLVIGPDEV
jgi:predicted nucleic acid-binding protein